jgi:hypothetical protein
MYRVPNPLTSTKLEQQAGHPSPVTPASFDHLLDSEDKLHAPADPLRPFLMGIWTIHPLNLNRISVKHHQGERAHARVLTTQEMGLHSSSGPGPGPSTLLACIDSVFNGKYGM